MRKFIRYSDSPKESKLRNFDSPKESNLFSLN